MRVDVVLPTPGSDGMKFREIVRLLEADGWKLVAQRGSHRQYAHPMKPGKVTVAGSRVWMCLSAQR